MAVFNAYHRWLGIPPDEQPAHLYRLLGIRQFEDDPEVILDAAERQIAHVRRYELGQHQELSQRLLNELAEAKACLLDASKKAAYDATLRLSPVSVEPLSPPLNHEKSISKESHPAVIQLCAVAAIGVAILVAALIVRAAVTKDDQTESVAAGKRHQPIEVPRPASDSSSETTTIDPPKRDAKLVAAPPSHQILEAPSLGNSGGESERRPVETPPAIVPTANSNPTPAPNSLEEKPSSDPPAIDSARVSSPPSDKGDTPEPNVLPPEQSAEDRIREVISKHNLTQRVRTLFLFRPADEHRDKGLASVRDLSGHRDGRLKKASISELGYRDGALYVDGSGAWLDLDDKDFPDRSQPRTIMLWFKVQGTLQRPGPLFFYGVPRSGDAMYVMISPATGVLVNGNWDGGPLESMGSRQVVDGAWHHVALVYEARGHVTVYLDGQPEIRHARKYNTSPTGTFAIGRSILNSPDSFLGWIDEFLLLDTALSRTEIIDIMGPAVEIRSKVPPSPGLPGTPNALEAPAFPSIQRPLTEASAPGQEARPKIAAEAARCTFLLTMQEPESETRFPFATAFAIDQQTVLTSGAVATEVARRIRLGWQMSLLDTSGEPRAIKQIYVPKQYTTLANDPQRRIFFDLGVIMVDRRFSQVLKFAPAEKLDALQRDQFAACFGFGHDGQPLRGAPAARLYMGTISAIVEQDMQETSPVASRLVELAAETDGNLYGSPIFNAQGQVLAIYAEQARGETSPLSLHYAPLVTMVSQWLDGQGRELWQPLSTKSTKRAP